MYVPGAEAWGLVAPSMSRPTLVALRPSQTMPTTGPDSTACQLMYAFLEGIMLFAAEGMKGAILNGRDGRTVLDELGEEGLVLEVGVVLLEVLLGTSVLSALSGLHCRIRRSGRRRDSVN